MTSRSLFFAQFFVLALVGAIHVTALVHSLYWLFPWLDLPVHLLGGMWVALLGAWCARQSGVRYRFLVALVGVLVVGAGWEIFEVLVGIPREANYAFDTSLDFVMDILGGALGYFLARLFR